MITVVCLDYTLFDVGWDGVIEGNSEVIDRTAPW